MRLGSAKLAEDRMRDNLTSGARGQAGSAARMPSATDRSRLVNRTGIRL
jgi:hypothetical protein